MQLFFRYIEKKFFSPYNYRKLSIVVVSKSKYFSELADDILIFLSKYNYEVNVSDVFPKKFYDVYIVINPLFQFNEKFRKNRKSLYVCMQTEQLNTPTQKGFMMLNKNVSFFEMKKTLTRFDTIFDFSRENTRFLKNFFENVRHINYGYDEKYDYSSMKSVLYDLIFIGASSGIDGRRSRILDILKSQYIFFSKHDDVWGEDKYRAISDSKIALNIHYDHSAVFESFRFFEYLSQGTFLLSEHTIDSYPFVDGIDYVSYHQDDLITKIDYYLKNDIERKKIAESGYNTVRRFSRYNTLSFMIHCIEIDFADKLRSKKKIIVIFYLFRFMSMMKRVFLKTIK